MIKAITYILENDATVQSLVGANSRDDKHKVYPVIAPITEKGPYIIVTLLSKSRVAKHCGFQYAISVTSYHETYDGSIQLNNAVIRAIENTASGNINGVDFSYMTFTDERDEYTVDRIGITHEHPLYAKVSIFTGQGDENGT
jgi:hypothetical protein